MHTVGVCYFECLYKSILPLGLQWSRLKCLTLSEKTTSFSCVYIHHNFRLINYIQMLLFYESIYFYLSTYLKSCVSG